MRVELINTGTEIILGQVLNTHLGYISDQLAEIGLRISRQIAAPDDASLKDIFAESIQRSDAVIITGGLGPTSDDQTRNIIAELMKADLEFHSDILEKIQAHFEQRNLALPEISKAQAMVPRGATALPNENGTAPGLYFEKEGKHIFCLPGPPRELQPMFRDSVWPILKNAAEKEKRIYEKTFRMLGFGETTVQEKLEAELRKFSGMEIGYCERPGEVDLRLITAFPEDLNQAEKIVFETFGDAIYTIERKSIEEVVVELAASSHQTIATAESCTGGLVAHRITNVPGASAVLNRGWVVYSNRSKVEELDVMASTIEKFGAVSSETAYEMALGALELSGANIAVAMTGIAGPTGGSPEKPVGTIFFCVVTRKKNTIEETSVERRIVAPRETFKHIASQIALDLLRRTLKSKT
ncbi:MAG: competence/damage-inducible protein A [Verrucomicrobiota bacterium]